MAKRLTYTDQAVRAQADKLAQADARPVIDTVKMMLAHQDGAVRRTLANLATASEQLRMAADRWESQAQIDARAKDVATLVRILKRERQALRALRRYRADLLLEG